VPKLCPANVFTFSRERGLMTARLSAPTRWHNRMSESNWSDDRGTPPTASLVGCNVLLDGRANEPSPVGMSAAAVSNESPQSGADSTDLVNPNQLARARALDAPKGRRGTTV
jgi:hypothetical protein